jgi:hypothetical protein
VERNARVEVRSRFDGSWCRGFAIAEVGRDGESYQVRRLSDGVVLPVPFSKVDIVAERARTGYDRRS